MKKNEKPYPLKSVLSVTSVVKWSLRFLRPPGGVKLADAMQAILSWRGAVGVPAENCELRKNLLDSRGVGC
jgi:hypothetical protein